MTDIYVKLVDGQPQEPPINKDNQLNYNLNIPQLIADGYKLLIPAILPPESEIRMYHIEYTETEENVIEIIIYDETQEEAEARELEQAKQEKIAENDTVRDEALVQGVTYQNILFDSDTDQKVNLLATVSMMNDEDTIVWYGMDNQPLECTKLDLLNIGGLITQLHSFCWNNNAEIKTAINEAKTVEEVESIKIDYKGE